jgi:hypothetical protein
LFKAIQVSNNYVFRKIFHTFQLIYKPI